MLDQDAIETNEDELDQLVKFKIEQIHNKYQRDFLSEFCLIR